MPTTTAQPAAEPIWFIDALAHVHVDGAQTGGALAIVEMRAREGDMPPLHVHHNEDEIFHVLEGEISLFFGDEQLTLEAGRAAVTKRGIPHTYRVESGEARWLVTTTPAGFESFVRAAGQAAPGDELPPLDRAKDPDAIGRAAAAAGIELLGPPGTLPS